MKRITFVLLFFFCLIVAFTSVDLPVVGDGSHQTHLTPGKVYVAEAYKKTATPNIVTAILADYRGFDTMLETAVVLIAGLALMLLLRKSRKIREDIAEDYQESDAEDHSQPSFIVKITCKFLIPPIQLFALYVLAHGHYSPGGGFQGGVILGASLILQSLVFGMREQLKVYGEKLPEILMFSGVILYALTGLISLFINLDFLNYAGLGIIFSSDNAHLHSTGILIVELGVAMTVMSVMYSLYCDLASQGKLDEGI